VTRSQRRELCRKNMVTKPGLIGNERERIFGGSALESLGRSCYWKTRKHGQQVPSPNKERTASHGSRSSLLSGPVRLRDIESFKRSPELVEKGRFASSLRLEYLGRLTINPADLAALKRCRVGDCDVKLTSEMIENIRRVPT
jgi:hypothetical protein